MKNKISLLLIALVISHISYGQILYPDSEFWEYYRVLEIKNPNIEKRLSYFPSIVSSYDNDSLSWNVWAENFETRRNDQNYFRFESFRFSNYYNSNYPRSYNDGAIWKGKGLNSAIQGGVSGKYGILEFTVAPVVYYAQNQSFELAPQQGANNAYNYQFRNGSIDWVQRYGDDPLTEFDWGQTDIRLVYKWLTLGASTQNFVMGPAQINPIIMSNQAAGVPHIDFGTNTPVSIHLGKWDAGKFEAKVFWGSLRESEYFDDIDTNNYRYWTALAACYSPSFLPGLSIGFHRAFYKKGEEFEGQDLLEVFTVFDNKNDTPNQNDEFDQIVSASMRWVFSEVGFEVYGEFGKNDFGGHISSSEPEHARAYTLGLSKYVDIGKNVMKLTYEHASLDKPRNSVYRFNNSWYSHHLVKQGYTHNGQILGAGIGSGSVSDFLEVQYFFKKGRIHLVGRRIRLDDDYFFTNVQTKFQQDHEWTIETKYSRFVKGYLLTAEFAYSKRNNMYFEKGNTQRNYGLGLSISKQFH